jgi:predicted anti-sigma-YlaC factor YlaD
MLTPVPPTDCMRAREGASARLDGELEELESARLDAHLLGCADCRDFLAEISGIATQLRGAALEQAPPVFVGNPRRRVHSPRFAAAAAVLAIVLVGTGSSFAVGRMLGGHGKATFRAVGTAHDVASLRADSAEQHLLAMLPHLGPADSVHAGRVIAV